MSESQETSPEIPSCAWEKDGKAHSKIEVVVQEVELPPRSGAVSAPAASGSSAAGGYDTVNVPYYDEDVVF